MSAAVISLRLDFIDAIKAAEQRGAVLPADFYGKLPEQARATAFTISGLASLAQIQQVQDSLTRATADGTSFRDWQKAALSMPELAALPKGRLDTIYRNAIQQNYMAGHWAQAVANKDTRPFLMYDAINDSRTRPTHHAMDNFIAPVDDPFWATHYPPNGFNCRCSARSLTEAQAKARGWQGFTPPAPAQPDKGWAYNPGTGGQVTALNKLVSEKIANSDPVISKALRATIENEKPLTTDDYIARGKVISATLPDIVSNPAQAHAELLSRLHEAVGTATPAKISTRGAGANLVKSASTRLPDSWTQAADALGDLFVRSKKDTRGWHVTPLEESGSGRLGDGFGVVTWNNSRPGYILVPTGSISVALHEYAHRVQSALPELDAAFQALHQRRTAGEKLAKLRLLTGEDYRDDELSQKDGYVDPYFGKIYEGRGALEVMTMALERTIGTDTNSQKSLSRFVELFEKDRELFDFALGLLFHWRPKP